MKNARIVNVIFLNGNRAIVNMTWTDTLKDLKVIKINENDTLSFLRGANYYKKDKTK